VDFTRRGRRVPRVVCLHGLGPAPPSLTYAGPLYVVESNLIIVLLLIYLARSISVSKSHRTYTLAYSVSVYEKINSQQIRSIPYHRWTWT
jgi:hypothetical protein